MGKKFKVKVIMISLKGNKVAETNEIVDESQLATDAKTLVKGGYIELIETKVEAKPKAKVEAKPKAKVEAKPKAKNK